MNTAGIKVGIFGAGSWGTALAQHLAKRSHRVCLWAFEADVVSGINKAHRNPLFLSEIELESSITATSDPKTAIENAAMLLFAIPTQFTRQFLVTLRDSLPAGVPLVICSKGIERKTLATLDQIFIEELPGKTHAGISVLSGPSFAIEVAQNMPTNVTVAARTPDTGKQVQTLIATRDFRVYTSDDVIGVELGGALKNVLAIAVGASDGLGLGNNTRAGLITRGLAEITRLAVSMGSKPETLLGLAGVGDLILTCTSDLSRNRLVGQLLAKGRTLNDILNEMRMVAEGVPTAESAYALGLRQKVEMPITEQLFKVLYENRSVIEAMRALQDRALKDEWGL